MLHALTCSQELNNLENALLSNCLLALRILSTDAATLYAAAYAKQQAPTSPPGRELSLKTRYKLHQSHIENPAYVPQLDQGLNGAIRAQCRR